MISPLSLLSYEERFIGQQYILEAMAYNLKRMPGLLMLQGAK